MKEEIKKEIEECMKYLSTNKYKRNYDWKGYEVYKPIYNKRIFIGYPFVVLVNGDEVRVSNIEESLEYMRYSQELSGINGEE